MVLKSTFESVACWIIYTNTLFQLTIKNPMLSKQVGCITIKCRFRARNGIFKDDLEIIGVGGDLLFKSNQIFMSFNILLIMFIF